MLNNLPTDTLPRLLRRTTLSAIIVGALGFLAAVFLAPPLAALGVLIGVGMAIVNLRFLDGQTAKIEMRGEQDTKAIRRQLGGRTTARLLLMTVVVLVAVFLNPPFGIGIVSGLVLYQLVFVLNVVRVVSQGGMER